MTIYRGDVEGSTQTSEPTSLPRSGPRGIDGYVIRKLTRQKGDLPPYTEWHVTCGRNPISIYVPNDPAGLSDHNIGNPYKTLIQAQQAIEIHKAITIKPVTVGEEFFDDKLNKIDPSVKKSPDLTFPDHKIIPYHKPAMDFMINLAFFVLGGAAAVLIMHFMK